MSQIQIQKLRKACAKIVLFCHLDIEKDVTNFTLKSNLTKNMLCGGGEATISYFRLDFNAIIYFLKSLYNFLIESNIIFHVKGLISFTFFVKLIDDRRKILSHLI